MPARNVLRLLFVAAAALTLPGCELVGDIFQAGMAVGMFLVLAVIALVIFMAARLTRRA
jgi:hypothetical protein